MTPKDIDISFFLPRMLENDSMCWLDIFDCMQASILAICS